MPTDGPRYQISRWNFHIYIDTTPMRAATALVHLRESKVINMRTNHVTSCKTIWPGLSVLYISKRKKTNKPIGPNKLKRRRVPHCAITIKSLFLFSFFLKNFIFESAMMTNDLDDCTYKKKKDFPTGHSARKSSTKLIPLK